MLDEQLHDVVVDITVRVFVLVVQPSTGEIPVELLFRMPDAMKQAVEHLFVVLRTDAHVLLLGGQEYVPIFF
ncbi:hypothetical protein D3C71_1864730 [compost metagenome]